MVRVMGSYFLGSIRMEVVMEMVMVMGLAFVYSFMESSRSC